MGFESDELIHRATHVQVPARRGLPPPFPAGSHRASSERCLMQQIDFTHRMKISQPQPLRLKFH